MPLPPAKSKPLTAKVLDQEPAPGNNPPPKPQFSIMGMFVVMLICSLASAGAYYLVRADGNDPSNKLMANRFK